MKHVLAASLLLCAGCSSFGQDLWQQELARMPLAGGIRQLNRTNCVDALLGSLGSNQTVKAVVFLPGATDQLYLFGKVTADLTNASPTLLDAIVALTNQTPLRVAFHPPLLLLYSPGDRLEPEIEVRDQRTADRLHQARFVPHALFKDSDWDSIEPLLRKSLGMDVRPWRRSVDSWHFYRINLIAWNLGGWETVEAVALAGKGKVAVDRKQVVFTLDRRSAAP